MMQSFFDKYNLNAFERRLVVVVGLVVFLIINMALVWPQFADWGEIGKKMDQAGQKIAAFNRLKTGRDQLLATNQRISERLSLLKTLKQQGSARSQQQLDELLAEDIDGFLVWEGSQ